MSTVAHMLNHGVLIVGSSLTLGLGFYLWKGPAVLVGFVVAFIILTLALFTLRYVHDRDTRWILLFEYMEMTVLSVGVCVSWEACLPAYLYGLLCGVIFMCLPSFSSGERLTMHFPHLEVLRQNQESTEDVCCPDGQQT